MLEARDLRSRVDVMREPEARVIESSSATICDRTWRPTRRLALHRLARSDSPLGSSSGSGRPL
jgi:hypothetical protein